MTNRPYIVNLFLFVDLLVFALYILKLYYRELLYKQFLLNISNMPMEK